MRLVPRRGATVHAVAVVSFGMIMHLTDMLHLLLVALALVALAFIIVGSNLSWWVILDIDVKTNMFTAVGLSKESFRFFLEMGLDHFDLRFHAKKVAMEKSFYARTDSYLWGILSYKCTHSSHIPSSACGKRSLITSLSSAMYVLLSLASLALAAVMGMLFLSGSPSLSFKTTTTFYGIAALLTLAALLIFELKLNGILSKPSSWAIWDDEIHSSFAGVDALRSVPKNSTFTSQPGISRLMVWIAFVSILTSFVCYLIRVYNTRKSKKYLNTFNTVFKSRPSLFVTVAEETLSGRMERLGSSQDSL